MPSDETASVESTEQQEQEQQDESLNLDELLPQTNTDEHEPPPEHPRFKQIYGRMKELERSVDAMRAEIDKREALIEEMRAHNERLAQAIERSSPTIDDTIASRIAAIKQEKEAALADGNFTKYDELNEELMELKLKQKELELERKEPRVPPEVRHFIDNNKWFIDNAAMRGAAIAIEQELNADPVWARKPIAMKLAEVSRRVKEAFGIKDTKPQSGADMGSSSRQQKTSGLTNEQKAVARALGIPEDEYLKQLKLIEKGG